MFSGPVLRANTNIYWTMSVVNVEKCENCILKLKIWNRKTKMSENIEIIYKNSGRVRMNISGSHVNATDMVSGCTLIHVFKSHFKQSTWQSKLITAFAENSTIISCENSHNKSHFLTEN